MRTKEIKVSPIKEMEIRASRIPGVISLAQGIPSFDTPLIVKRKAVEAIEKGLVSKYSLTQGLPTLREAIEEKLTKENLNYDFENEIIVTAGSIEGISSTLLTILEKNDEVIIFSPSYASYNEVVKVAYGKPISVNLEEENKWSLNLENLEKAISEKTKAILLCNPNNPTGNIFSKEEILNLTEIALKYNLFILNDEVYKDFVFEGNFFSLSKIKKLRKKLINFFSFSKVYAMTGWRIGFLYGDQEIVKEILKVHDSLVTCAPVVSQYAALAALDLAQEDLEKYKKIYLKRRDLICSYLDKLKDFFSYQKPCSTYYVFPKLLKEKDSWNFSLDLLEKAKVAVVPGIAFGPSGEQHIRMSFAASEENINEAFRRIEKYFKNRYS